MIVAQPEIMSSLIHIASSVSPTAWSPQRLCSELDRRLGSSGLKNFLVRLKFGSQAIRLSFSNQGRFSKAIFPLVHCSIECFDLMLYPLF